MLTMLAYAVQYHARQSMRPSLSWQQVATRTHVVEQPRLSTSGKQVLALLLALLRKSQVLALLLALLMFEQPRLAPSGKQLIWRWHTERWGVC